MTGIAKAVGESLVLYYAGKGVLYGGKAFVQERAL